MYKWNKVASIVTGQEWSRQSLSQTNKKEKVKDIRQMPRYNHIRSYSSSFSSLENRTLHPSWSWFNYYI